MADQTPTPEISTPAGGYYERCSCATTKLGHACLLCRGTKWLKRCEACNGSGKIYRNRGTQHTPMGEVHGFCAGRGWVPCNQHDIQKALDSQQAAAEAKK